MALPASAKCSSGISVDRLAQGSVRRPRIAGTLSASLEGERCGTSVDPKRMSSSNSACVGVATSKPRRSSRKSNSPNFMGGVAVLGLVLGCGGWTVGNVLRADVYPTLGTANYDAPIVRHSWSSAVYQPKPAPYSVVADAADSQSYASETVRSGSSLSFSERFAAAAPRSVDPKPQPDLPRLAESPRTQGEAPKLAAAPRAKEAASTPVQLAALSATPRQVESRPATSA